MQLARLGITLVLAALVACGGRQESAETPTHETADQPAAPATAEQRNQAKLDEAQRVGCEGYCERVTSCAVEDAKANMSPEELAELNLEETAPAMTRECMDKCTGSQLSVRQVEVMHQCLSNASSTCEEFATCMDAMTPQKGQ